MHEQLTVNGFPIDAVYSKTFINHQLQPLIHQLKAMAESKQRRIIVFLAAPPAMGKSTLALFLEKLEPMIQAVSLDGFHYPQEYLNTHTIFRNHQSILLKEIKGSPETYDLAAFKRCLKQLQTGDSLFPIYDRNVHDVVKDQLKIERPIVVIEGNWLLLDEDGWCDLKAYADLTVFLSGEMSCLKQRLIERKMRGGLDEKAAHAFYEQSDRFNVERVLAHRLKADVELTLDHE